MSQTELAFPKKLTKDHSFVPATALRTLLDNKHFTRGEFCTLVGIHDSTLSKRLAANSMPKGMALLCGKLLAEATTPQEDIKHTFLVSVPQADLPSFKTILFSLNLPHQQLSL